MNERLIELRKRAGFQNRDDFAKTIGVTAGTYKNWEQGLVQLRASVICMLCDYFDVSADYLLGRDRPSQIDTPEDAAFYEAYSSLDEGHQEMLGQIAQDFQRSEAYAGSDGASVSVAGDNNVVVQGDGNVVGDNNMGDGFGNTTIINNYNEYTE